jgi:hypothetical protein
MSPKSTVCMVDVIVHTAFIPMGTSSLVVTLQVGPGTHRSVGLKSVE